MNEPTAPHGQAVVPATCPRCGEALESGATFCMECGLRVTEQAGFATQSPANHGTCLACGAPLEVDADFCDQCGIPVKKSCVIEAPRPVPPVQDSTVNECTCATCGAPIEPGAAFCDQCGEPVPTKLPALARATPSPHMQTSLQSWFKPLPQPFSGVSIVEPKERVCPRCGTAVSVDNKFCDSCGLDLRVAHAAKTNEEWSSNLMHPQHNEEFATGAPTIIIEADGGVDGKLKDEVSANVRSQLIILSRQEARAGCIKEVVVDGESIKVPIPAGVHDSSTVEIPGRGYIDEETGARGPLRLSVFIG